MSGLRALVVGGSLGGLSAAIALRDAGCDVQVAERSSGRMRGSGAGLVVQPETLAFLEGPVGAPRHAYAVASRERLYLDLHGGGQVAPSHQLMTSWGAVYGLLRGALPDDRVHAGRTLATLDARTDGVAATFEDGSSTNVDLLVAADGTGSTCRARLEPFTLPTYASYVGWRGVLSEADAPARLLAVFRDRFVFFQGARTQALCYLIPGADGHTDDGARQLNWVWYRNVPAGPALDDLRTDRDGRVRDRSVPPDAVRPALAQALRRDARTDLPTAFADLVEATPEPFVQTIVDLACEQTVYGRAVLVGDAAFTPRPHTAASTSKAIADAVALGHAVAADGPVDLHQWGRERAEFGRLLGAHGRRLGAQSGLG